MFDQKMMLNDSDVCDGPASPLEGGSHDDIDHPSGYKTLEEVVGNLCHSTASVLGERGHTICIN